MKKVIFFLIISAVFFVIAPFTRGVSAATLKFDKGTYSSSNNSTFQVQVIVDAGSDQVTSTDAYVLYDATILEAQTVTAGTFFPTVTNNINSGKVYIAGMVDDPATSKTGLGTLATITFKTLIDGTGNLTFDCTDVATGPSKIIKNDINATNIIVCSQNSTATYNVGVGSSPVVPTALPRTGIVENIMKYSVPGTVLLFFGLTLRLLQ